MLLKYCNPRYLEFAKTLSTDFYFDPAAYPEIHDPNVYDRRQKYLGNPLIKRAHVSIIITPEMEEELARCAMDKLYFAERYFYIRTLDHGKIKIPLRDYQKEWLRVSEQPKIRYRMNLAARQSAKSTTLTVEVLHDLIFRKDYQTGILAHKGDTAREILSRVKMAYEMLPFWMQIGVKEWNKNSIILENDCKAFSNSTSSDSVRGLSLNHIILDEFAFVMNDEDFITGTLPVISAGSESKLTMISTPNGKKGEFYKTWMKALKGHSNYFTFGVPWYLVPGRDEKWKKETIEASNDVNRFRQEHGIQFVANSTSLIDPMDIERMENDYREPIDTISEVKIYAYPEQNHSYIMSVDTAEGKGMDNSTFTVFDVTSLPYQQVATYKENGVTPIVFAHFIERFLIYYNDALAIVENNNASGAVVANELFTNIGYENTYCMDAVSEMGIGVRTTKKTKSIGCSTLKSFVRSENMNIICLDTISELGNFEADGTSFNAADGCTDDLVQNLWLFSWFTAMPDFQDYINTLVDVNKEINQDQLSKVDEMEFPEPQHIQSHGSINDIW